MKNLKLPCVGFTEGTGTEKVFSMEWSTVDGYAQLIFDPATARIEWFTKDRTTGQSMGSEEQLDYLPAVFWNFVFATFEAPGKP